MTAMITRFAPAPTGFLHLGHVVNAFYVWGMAEEAGGAVRLRIEDHDRQRSRPEFEAAIFEDLAWLGFAASGPIVRQSERDEVYRSAVATLANGGRMYGCTCTRADLQQTPADINGERRYPGTCRNRGIGSALLKELVDEARAAGVPLRSSVAVTNPASLIRLSISARKDSPCDR